jgi:hypothetical protein
MRWIAASLLVINVVALLVQLLMPGSEAVARENRPELPQLRGNTQLKLLGELDEPALQVMVQAKEKARLAAARAVVDAEKPPLCTLVGPFPELLKAEYFQERLAALDVAASIQDLEIPGEVSYWIYLPPRESRKQAFNELRELQAKGIDSYVIPRGELANGISFGMFSQPNLAKGRLEDMRSRGYPAELREITRTYKETWVVVPSIEAAKLDSESWLQTMAAGDNLERRQNFCPPVASE